MTKAKEKKRQSGPSEPDCFFLSTYLEDTGWQAALADAGQRTLSLARVRKPAVTARSPTTLELHIQLLLLLLPRLVFLFLDPYS
jgi:hypothetical protein